MTGLLVRSTATNWSKGSVLAVDAGTHLAAVINIFEEHLPNAILRRPSISSNGVAHSSLSPHADQGGRHPSSTSSANGHGADTPQGDGVSPSLVLSTGPLANFELPHTTAKANAAYFVRNLITTYLITHPHLDHISGFVINTAGFQHTSRPKRLAGLRSTIDAFKTHIFNDTIWPNLSDEDGGVGLVSYMRLAEGGNVAIGEGEGRGYIEVCDGLAVKSWSVSHGKCMHNHGHRGSGSGNNQETFNDSLSRRASQHVMTPTSLQHSQNYGHSGGFCVTDSSAFFLRDDHTGNEVLIFGDVEPDSLSLSPRTAQVWSDAAPKIAAGLLKGVLIECSYDESQSDDTLFGHLAPRHVIAELQVLAQKVRAHKHGEAEFASLKRKRMSNGLGMQEELETPTRLGRASHPPRRKSRKANASPAPLIAEDGMHHDGVDGSEGPTADGVEHALTPGTIADDPMSLHSSLDGLQVIIIHVKDNLKDGPYVGDTILAQLEEMERQAQLGCTFAISKPGTSIWL